MRAAATLLVLATVAPLLACARTAAPPAAPATAPLLAPGRSAPTALPPEFAALVDHVRSRVTLWREGAPINSLVLDSRQTVLNPVAIDCQRREPLVIIDLDPAGQTPMQPGVTAAPGWSDTLSAIRAEGVGIAWVTGQSAADADIIRTQLVSAGLDRAGTDPIAGPATTDDRKQSIRQRLALRFCILAVVGDIRSDADEAYDYLRSPDMRLPIDSNWGEGWFLLPAPLIARGSIQ